MRERERNERNEREDGDGQAKQPRGREKRRAIQARYVVGEDYVSHVCK
jgi:hypothetical protein